MENLAHAGRRAQLLVQCEALYIVTAFDEMQLSNDAAAPFLQEANFFYLTGIDEPCWLLLVEKGGKSILIAPEVSDVHRIFDGGLSYEQAKKISGVDEVLSKKAGEAYIRKIATHNNKIGMLGIDPHSVYNTFAPNPAPQRLRDLLIDIGATTKDIRPYLAKQRSQKSTDELRHMRVAINLTCATFAGVKNKLPKLTHEYMIDAAFSFAFRNVDAIHAYEPIVAAGENACTLHYVKNSAKLPKNGLVLMDIGARIGGYAADITRTYAIGTPSEREVAVHAAVEKAHHKIIALLKPGLSLKTYSEQVDEIMKDALQEVNLLEDRTDQKTYRKYFPHAISHGLGLDVHESLGGYNEFQPGMVLTVEPGIHIPEEGIGVRIEDDILITENGYENLSAALPTSL